MRIADLIVALSGGAATYYYAPSVNETVLRDIVGTIAVISGTLLGFAAAAIAILMSMPDTKFVRNLQRTGHIHELLNQMYWATVWSFGSVVSALVSMFFPAQIMATIAALVAAFLSASIVRLGLSGRRFYTILSVFAEARLDEPLE